MCFRRGRRAFLFRVIPGCRATAMATNGERTALYIRSHIRLTSFPSQLDWCTRRLRCVNVMTFGKA